MPETRSKTGTSRSKTAGCTCFIQKNEKCADVYRSLLGPTPDETILAGLQTVIDMCGILEANSQVADTERPDDVQSRVHYDEDSNYEHYNISPLEPPPSSEPDYSIGSIPSRDSIGKASIMSRGSKKSGHSTKGGSIKSICKSTGKSSGRVTSSKLRSQTSGVQRSHHSVRPYQSESVKIRSALSSATKTPKYKSDTQQHPSKLSAHSYKSTGSQYLPRSSMTPAQLVLQEHSSRSIVGSKHSVGAPNWKQSQPSVTTAKSANQRSQLGKSSTSNRQLWSQTQQSVNKSKQSQASQSMYETMTSAMLSAHSQRGPSREAADLTEIKSETRRHSATSECPMLFKEMKVSSEKSVQALTEKMSCERHCCTCARHSDKVIQTPTSGQLHKDISAASAKSRQQSKGSVKKPSKDADLAKSSYRSIGVNSKETSRLLDSKHSVRKYSSPATIDEEPERTQIGTQNQIVSYVRVNGNIPAPQQSALSSKQNESNVSNTSEEPTTFLSTVPSQNPPSVANAEYGSLNSTNASNLDDMKTFEEDLESFTDGPQSCTSDTDCVCSQCFDEVQSTHSTGQGDYDPVKLTQRGIRYACVKITEFDEYTTYEVLNAPVRRPKHACVPQGVFVVKKNS